MCFAGYSQTDLPLSSLLFDSQKEKRTRHICYDGVNQLGFTFKQECTSDITYCRQRLNVRRGLDLCATRLYLRARDQFDASGDEAAGGLNIEQCYVISRHDGVEDVGIGVSDFVGGRDAGHVRADRNQFSLSTVEYTRSSRRWDSRSIWTPGELATPNDHSRRSLVLRASLVRSSETRFDARSKKKEELTRKYDK